MSESFNEYMARRRQTAASVHLSVKPNDSDADLIIALTKQVTEARARSAELEAQMNTIDHATDCRCSACKHYRRP